MPKPDGSIRIDTKIESGNVTSQMMKIANAIKKDMAELDQLNAKMDELANKKIPTQEYQNLIDYIQSTEKHIANVIELQKSLENKGLQGSDVYKNATDSLEKMRASLETANADLKNLVETGRDFTLGKDTEQFSEMSSRAGELSDRIDVNNLRLREMYAKQKPVSEEFSKMSKSAKKAFNEVSKGTKKSSGLFSSFISRLKGISLSLLVFNWISKGFNAMISGMKKGFENFSGYSDSYANSVQSMKNAMATLENQLAAGFAPIIQMVVPWINQLISALSTAISYVSQFIAVLGGNSTFTKAKKVQDSYNKSLNNTASAAKKAAGALASFDTLEVLNKKDSGGGSGGGSDASEMFEEVPVDQKVVSWLGNIKSLLQPVIDYMKELKDIFMSGFWDGLGDWEYRIDSIKESASVIKESLMDIFTDPAVLASADGYVKSVVSMFGTLVGSLASIGLTIATNIVGGIAIYIEENKERIKDYLVSMFDIWGDVNNILSSLFDSVAFVFEAFAGEKGQNLTANLIGIFTGAFMGVTEIASKLIREILNIFIQPFVDNKEGFRTALEGFLGVLAEVAGTIKDSINETFDKLNEVYDKQLKPFFDDIANGLSWLVGKWLEFWNGNVQPILEKWSQLFDELWGGHVQPVINNIIEIVGNFVGIISGILEKLWKNILQPLISWIIDNILPAVLSVIDGVVSSLFHFVETVMDIGNKVLEVLKKITSFLELVFRVGWENVWGYIVDFATSVLQVLIDWVVDNILPVILPIIEEIIENIKLFLEKVGYVVDRVKDYIEIIKFSMSLFQIYWENIWKKFGDIMEKSKNVMKGIINSILGFIEKMVNGFVDGVNDIIHTLERLATIKNPLTGQVVWSLDLPEVPKVKIPRLADGAVLRGGNPFMAIVNDQPRGQTNVETPVSVIEDAVNHAFDNRQIQQPVEAHITMMMNGEVVGEAIIDNLMSALNRRGYDVDILGWNGG